MERPFSQACENNQGPILEVIRPIFAGVDQVLGEDIEVLQQVEQRLREGYPQVGMMVPADRALMEYQRWCQKHKSSVAGSAVPGHRHSSAS